MGNAMSGVWNAKSAEEKKSLRAEGNAKEEAIDASYGRFVLFSGIIRRDIQQV